LSHSGLAGISELYSGQVFTAEEFREMSLSNNLEFRVLGIGERCDSFPRRRKPTTTPFSVAGLGAAQVFDRMRLRQIKFPVQIAGDRRENDRRSHNIGFGDRQVDKSDSGPLSAGRVDAVF
jgi:hypothetical protein